MFDEKHVYTPPFLPSPPHPYSLPPPLTNTHQSINHSRSNQKSCPPPPSSSPLTPPPSTTTPNTTPPTPNPSTPPPRPAKGAEPTLLLPRHDLQVRAPQVEPLTLALWVVTADHVAVRAAQAVAVLWLERVVRVRVFVLGRALGGGGGARCCCFFFVGLLGFAGAGGGAGFAAGWVGAWWGIWDGSREGGGCG